MSNRFWVMVNKVIDDANILILVLDARMVEETRNDEIESKVKALNKPLIYVLNKCDLVDKSVMEHYARKLPNSIFISTKNHQGTSKLRQRIMITASRNHLKSIKVGVLGYPNVGKSSVINALKGKTSAPSSSMSGYTKHIQKVRTSSIVLLDTPGVIPYSDTAHNADAHAKHAMIGSIDYTKEKNPDSIAVELMKAFPGIIEHHYHVAVNKDGEKTIEDIALKCNLKAKGNIPDVLRAARMILKDWQLGKITHKTEM